LQPLSYLEQPLRSSCRRSGITRGPRAISFFLSIMGAFWHHSVFIDRTPSVREMRRRRGINKWNRGEMAKEAEENTVAFKGKNSLFSTYANMLQHWRTLTLRHMLIHTSTDACP